MIKYIFHATRYDSKKSKRQGNDLICDSDEFVVVNMWNESLLFLGECLSGQPIVGTVY